MPEIRSLLEEAPVDKEKGKGSRRLEDQEKPENNGDSRSFQENSLKKRDKTLLIAIGVVGLLAIFSALIYALSSLNYWKGKPTVSPLNNGDGTTASVIKDNAGVSGVDLGDTPSYINGTYTPAETEEIWMNRRPLGIMINNHVSARPQTCLQNADAVYEAVAEGGITRFLAIYLTKDCNAVGPVRSARVYYLDWIAEYQGIYAHWGAAYQDPNDPNVTFPEADAYLKINELNLPSLDQMWVGSLAYYRKDRPGKALEHTGYTSTPKLWEAYKTKYPEQGWRKVIPFDMWEFKDDAPKDSRPDSETITFDFWDNMPGYDVKWEYVPEDNNYRRYQGGDLIKDEETGSEIRAKVIIVQMEKETKVGDKKNHLLYGTLGTGEALVFQDGVSTNGTWSKSSSRSRTKYFDLAGEPIKFNRGQIWIEIVPIGNSVSYQ